jgi:DNA topoisomerase-1
VYEDDALETTSQQNFHEKQIINIQSCNTKQCFTQPPAKLNESTLVKKLKELGIGRPSTYAYIIETLRNRKYVTIEKQIFSSTEIGKKIVSFLQDNFSLYIDYNFTSKMETELDKIANNQLEAMNFINDFSKTLYDNILAFSLLDENKNCKNCGAEIELRIGRFGPFCCCKNYPSCKYTIRRKNYNKFNLSSQNDLNNTSTTLCPKCHKGRMILRKSKKNSKNFYACDNFPSCKNIYSGITNKHICPACSGNAIYYKYNEPNLYCFNCGKEFIETTSD